MHTCPPPKEALDEWLEPFPSIDGNYGHLLLEQIAEVDDALIEALKPYFESAHLDAREHFHAQIGISLHPDTGASVPAVSYPNCLPAKAHRGLFGEVIAGLVTQAYQEESVSASGAALDHKAFSVQTNLAPECPNSALPRAPKVVLSGLDVDFVPPAG